MTERKLNKYCKIFFITLCLYSIEKLVNYKKYYVGNYYSLSFLKKSLQYTLLLLLKLKENDVKATFRKSFCRPFLQTKMSERNCYFIKMRNVSYSKFLKQTFNFFLFHARYIEKFLDIITIKNKITYFF